MEPRYNTLQTIVEVVKDDPSPQTYLCNPGQIIARQSLPWDHIMQHLNELSAEGLIIFKRLESTVICITLDGIKKAKSFPQPALKG
jgi:predicted transcriptional regulator